MTPYRDPSPPENDNVGFDYVALVSRPEPRWGQVLLVAFCCAWTLAALYFLLNGPSRPSLVVGIVGIVWVLYSHVTSPKTLEEYEKRLEEKYDRDMAKRARVRTRR